MKNFWTAVLMGILVIEIIFLVHVAHDLMDMYNIGADNS